MYNPFYDLIVRRGAAALDRDRAHVSKHWRSTIDKRSLDMAEEKDCILGQVFGGFRFAPSRFVHHNAFYASSVWTWYIHKWHYRQLTKA